MRWLQTIAREVIGLFVEDGSFALAIVAWLVLVVLVLPRVAPVAPWGGPLLSAGLVTILAESVLRFGRRGR